MHQWQSDQAKVRIFDRKHWVLHSVVSVAMTLIKTATLF